MKWFHHIYTSADVLISGLQRIKTKIKFPHSMELNHITIILINRLSQSLSCAWNSRLLTKLSTGCYLFFSPV